MKKTLFINFFGAPCAGKSTIAAGLFYKLKLQGWSAELVLEFAKELVYSDRKKCLADQLYVTATQNHLLTVLNGEVDFVVIDSPMLLGAFYTPKGYPFSFSLFLIDMFNTYNNLNFFIKRAVPYVQEGRVQTEAESDKKAVAMQKFLKTNKIPYMPINGDEDAINTILATITKKHK